MSNGIGAAVDEAARLDEIGFPEFVSSLLSEVLESVVSNQVQQE